MNESKRLATIERCDTTIAHAKTTGLSIAIDASSCDDASIRFISNTLASCWHVLMRASIEIIDDVADNDSIALLHIADHVRDIKDAYDATLRMRHVHEMHVDDDWDV